MTLPPLFGRFLVLPVCVVSFRPGGACSPLLVIAPFRAAFLLTVASGPAAPACRVEPWRISMMGWTTTPMGLPTLNKNKDKIKDKNKVDKTKERDLDVLGVILLQRTNRPTVVVKVVSEIVRKSYHARKI